MELRRNALNYFFALALLTSNGKYEKRWNLLVASVPHICEIKFYYQKMREKHIGKSLSQSWKSHGDLIELNTEHRRVYRYLKILCGNLLNSTENDSILLNLIRINRGESKQNGRVFFSNEINDFDLVGFSVRFVQIHTAKRAKWIN